MTDAEQGTAAKAPSGVSGFFWAAGLFLIALIYVLFEWAFNARLVDAAYTVSDIATIEVLELEGRSLAAFGSALLVFKLIAPRPSLKRAVVGVLAAVLVFPVVFHGQRLLVDTLVETTGGAERQDAQVLALFRTSLSTGAVQIGDVSFADAALQGAEAKTFITTTGFLAFFDSSFTERLRAAAPTIIGIIADHKAAQALPEAYAGYREMEAAAIAAYDDYRAALAQRDAAIRTELAAVPDQWATLQTELVAAYQAKIENTEPARQIALARQVQEQFARYRRARSQCNAADCAAQLEQSYRSQVETLAGRYVPPDYWCEPDRTEVVTVRQGIRLETIERTVPGRCNDLPLEHFVERMGTLIGAPDSFEAFLRLEEIVAATRQQLTDAGLSLPLGWQLTDRDGFFTAATTKIQTEADGATSDAIEAALGVPLPLTLTAESFVRDTNIQRRLQTEMGLGPDQPVVLGLGAEAFSERYLQPRLVAEVEAQRDRLMTSAEALAEGGTEQQAGRNYVKAVLVPPIALAVSLLVSMVNLILLIGDLPALLGVKSRVVQTGLKLTGLVLLIGLPFVAGSPSAQSPGLNYLAQSAEESLGPGSALVSKWVVATQPLVYPVGHSMASIVPRFSSL